LPKNGKDGVLSTVFCQRVSWRERLTYQKKQRSIALSQI
jgi:hypothetical protein